MGLFNIRKLATIGGVCLSVLAAGCGGGGSNTPAASTLSGTAAVGFPIVSGAISVNCAAGSALTATTGSAGGWEVTVSGQALPCAVQVSGGTINGAANSTLYHSIATAFGIVNVTPLTDMMVANLARTATPGTWFAGLRTTPTPLTTITQANVDTALASLRTALGLAPLNTIHPVTTAFTPTRGNISDDMLAALKTAMTSASVTYASLLSNASAATLTMPAGFGAAMTAAYAGMTGGGTGGGGGSGGGTCATPVCLTITGTVTTMGFVVTIPSTTVSGLPAGSVPSTASAGGLNTSIQTAYGALGTISNFSYAITSSTASRVVARLIFNVTSTTPNVPSAAYDLTYTYAL